jgi:hypothetical protein
MNRLMAFQSKRMAIQAKLSIGEPNDKYEQEADATASKVVQQINSPTQKQSVQREEIPQEEELQMKSLVQRRENLGGVEASTDLESSIQSARGTGQSLDTDLQEKMGQAMGVDFSGVKVHTDSQSDQLNKSIQAKAFTTGQDVFFRQGAYEPGSRGGQELIAHELTHVVQQNDNHKSKNSPQDLSNISSPSQPELQCAFAKPASLTSHYYKHVTKQGDAGGAYASEAEYETAADNIVADSSSQSKPRGGGGMYYFNATTGQFVATNSDGGVLTMFVPTDRQAYFDKQT